MNIIFKRLAGGYELPKEKQRRTVEMVLGFTQYGECISAKGCEPQDRDKTVKEMFANERSIVTINVQPLKGRTKIIRR